MPLTMTMKIQPIDSTEPETKSFESVNNNNKTVPNKSRFKRLFDFSSFLRGSDKSVSEPLEFGGEPNSVCLDKMVMNFIEESNNNINNNESDVVSDDDVNCFGNSVNDGFCDALKSLVVCESVVERNLLADVAKMVFDKNKRKDEISRKMVVDGLLGCGYAVTMCKSRWDKTSTYPAGEYEYIDAIIEEERLIIDIDFRSEFEIARSTKSYKAVLQTLPQIFVGKPDRLQKIINIVSDAAKQSLKKKGMPLPPWRRADYVKAKWLSPCTHIANTTVNADNIPADKQSFNEKTTKPNPISDPKENLKDQTCNFSKLLTFFTKGLIVTSYDFKRTFGDFSFEISAQGLFLTTFETWGTETANYANLAHFSSDFKHFASETYKMQF